MTHVLPFNSWGLEGKAAVYHDESECPEGAEIGPEYIWPGDGGLKHCEMCAAIGAHGGPPRNPVARGDRAACSSLRTIELHARNPRVSSRAAVSDF